MMLKTAYTYQIAALCATNDTLAACTLGIEVTEASVAARCELGNIDPQHKPEAAPDAPAAIEACLDHPLPPLGARLTTMRPDADALGAMALLELRAAGAIPDKAMRNRVARIAAADRFDRGHWPGPRPLPASLSDLLAEGPGEEHAVLAACALDQKLPLAERVAAFMRFLADGVLPEEQETALRARAERLLLSLSAGATRATATAKGRIAVVISLEPGALMLGYRLAPVVLALNPCWTFPTGLAGRKYTVARWHAEDADLSSFASQISSLESGWGGQAGIMGSPQDRPSVLTVETIVDLLDSELATARAA